VKPHNNHAPGLPSEMNRLIDKAARRLRRHVDRELAAAAAAESVKRESKNARTKLAA
jgi:hypothetical protein